MPTTQTKTKDTAAAGGSRPRPAAKGMEATVYNREGKEAGTIKLSDALFGLRWNADLVHQVITSMRSNERQPIAHARDRGDVRGGGKKPWRQKGTGRARHGSSRSPIWVGGGVTHGPINEKNFDRKVNKKMKTKALFTLLSAKFRDGELVFVDDLALDTTPKTKLAQDILNNLAKAGFEKINYKRGKRAIVTVPKADLTISKSFRNIESALVADMMNINPLDLVTYKYVVIAKPQESLDIIAKRAK
ncbi:MAG TPA: 50S ribosomal protein L4 [Candidatus Paceibacterota bacterium]|nr:50S ribosomal protein L4 [Candidatus Paceibacterota bacterium]